MTRRYVVSQRTTRYAVVYADSPDVAIAISAHLHASGWMDDDADLKTWAEETCL